MSIVIRYYLLFDVIRKGCPGYPYMLALSLRLCMVFVWLTGKGKLCICIIVFISKVHFIFGQSKDFIILQSISGHFSKPGSQVCFEYSELHYQIWNIVWNLQSQICMSVNKVPKYRTKVLKY